MGTIIENKRETYNIKKMKRIAGLFLVALVASASTLGIYTHLLENKVTTEPIPIVVAQEPAEMYSQPGQQELPPPGGQTP